MALGNLFIYFPAKIAQAPVMAGVLLAAISVLAIVGGLYLENKQKVKVGN
mgnify:FL=1